MRYSKTLAVFIVMTALMGCGKASASELKQVETSTEAVENKVKETSEKDSLTQENETEPVIKVREPEIHNIKLVMVGDDLIHSGIYKAAKQSDGSYNFNMMFEHIKDDIESADIAIINQETIFTADRKNISSYPMFGSPIEVGDAIVNAGFDIVACATNHTMDKGMTGINDTINFWETNYPDIKYLGIHKDADDSDIRYIDKCGLKFSFVNYTYGLNGLESRRTGKEYSVDILTDDDIESTLKEANENSDITVAILHVGTEYVYEPTEYEKEQVNRFIDNGADIVLCAHPHVVEPYEMITTPSGNTGLVYYSLGNFISCQDKLPRILGGMAEINIKYTDYDENDTKHKDTWEITEYTMTPLITHQTSSYYTTYKLSDYTDELCKQNKRYASNHFTVTDMQNLFDSIVYKNK